MAERPLPSTYGASLATQHYGSTPTTTAAPPQSLRGEHAQHETGAHRGLPDTVRAPLEQLSGISLSAVRVHVSSDEPTRLGAKAFTRGTDIVLAPGQEHHLAHEAWHVVQQAQGRVPTSAHVGKRAINDDDHLENEADRISAHISGMPDRSLPPAALNSLPAAEPSRVATIQRVIAGLGDMTAPSHVPDDWVDLYLADILDDTTHLWDEDIIAFLDRKDRAWQAHAELMNTGGDHWDVRLGSAHDVRTIKTAPDGNCACHAIHAVLVRDKLTEKVISNFKAPRKTINEVRQSVQVRMAADRDEVRKRIAFEVQRSPFAAFTGFGPGLLAAVQEREQAEREKRPATTVIASSQAFASASSSGKNGPPPVDLGRFARFERLLDVGVPSGVVRSIMLGAGIAQEEADKLLNSHTAKKDSPNSKKSAGGGAISTPPSAKDDGRLREQLLEVERQLMDLYTVEIDEARFLKDLKVAFVAHHKPKLRELDQAQQELSAALKQNTPDSDTAETQAKVEKLQAEIDELTRKFKERYALFASKSQKCIQTARLNFSENLSQKKLEWMRLMSQLVGTKTPGDSVSVRAPFHRHDAGQGAYGRPPTEEDALVGHRHLEVLHGHGGWRRTGLVTEGALNSQMAGLTSLGEILAAANEVRRNNGLRELKAAQVDLAFVNHHGISIMGDDVVRGAGPNVLPLPPDLHRKVLDLLGEAHSQKLKPDEFIKSKAGNFKTDMRKQQYAKQQYARGREWEYQPVWTWTDPALWVAFQRVVKQRTAGGEAARYVDVINAETHGDVRFPDATLGYLKGVDSGKSAMEAVKNPHYRLTLIENLKAAEENVKTTTKWEATLSQAMVERLAEIEVGDRPVRVVWAACRADQWPTGFDDSMLFQWIKKSAELRRQARGW